MSAEDSWQEMSDALEFAVSRIEGDPDSLNDRERADGNLYVMRMLTAVTQSTSLTLDPDSPAFLTMLDGVRFVGAAGPDIDYDVAAVRPDSLYSISGEKRPMSASRCTRALVTAARQQLLRLSMSTTF